MLTMHACIVSLVFETRGGTSAPSRFPCIGERTGPRPRPFLPPVFVPWAVALSRGPSQRASLGAARGSVGRPILSRCPTSKGGTDGGWRLRLRLPRGFDHGKRVCRLGSCGEPHDRRNRKVPPSRCTKQAGESGGDLRQSAFSRKAILTTYCLFGFLIGVSAFPSSPTRNDGDSDRLAPACRRPSRRVGDSRVVRSGPCQ